MSTATPVLHEFLAANREELIARCRKKVSQRFDLNHAPVGDGNGVPAFLAQLIDTLRGDSTDADGSDFRKSVQDPRQIGRTAGVHGTEMLRLGYTIDQVVREYGDVCQSVTDLAVEARTSISPDEFRTLNRCLDDAIADAVTAFGSGQRALSDGSAADFYQRIELFADKHRRLIAVAEQTISAIRAGNVGVTGATGTLLSHTLEELGRLPEGILHEIRLASATTTAVRDKAPAPHPEVTWPATA